MDSDVAPPYTSNHTQEYCRGFSFQATNTVASYCGSPLSFLSRETSRKRREWGWSTHSASKSCVTDCLPTVPCSSHLPARWSSTGELIGGCCAVTVRAANIVTRNTSCFIVAFYILKSIDDGENQKTLTAKGAKK